MQSSLRRYLLSVATVVAVASVGAVLLVDLPISRTRADSGAKGPPPPVAVSVATVEPKQALTWDEFSGRLEASSGSRFARAWPAPCRPCISAKAPS